jgi:hypothetical protein
VFALDPQPPLLGQVRNLARVHFDRPLDGGLLLEVLT